MQRLLDAHDAVAQKDYNPRLSELPPEVDKDEETIKIAQLVKSDEPLVRVTSLSFIHFFPNNCVAMHVASSVL